MRLPADSSFHEWNIGGARGLGLIDGQTRVFFGRIVAVIVTWLFAAALTFVLLRILDATVGLRVSQEEEIQGLDLSQHGEEGYIFIESESTTGGRAD